MFAEGVSTTNTDHMMIFQLIQQNIFLPFTWADTERI